jgi:hypothetical protein
MQAEVQKRYWERYWEELEAMEKQRCKGDLGQGK